MNSSRSACLAFGLGIVLMTAISAAGATMAVPVADLEVFLDVPPQTLLGAGNGMPVEGSAVQRTFQAAAGDALTFNYGFLTNEELPAGLNTINDFAFLSLVRAEVTVIADLFSPFQPSSTSFASETNYRTWTTVLTEAGTYTLKLGVVDTVDDSADSALLVDNLKLNGVTLENFGFESGTLSDFLSIGDARVVGAEFGVTPSEGNRQLLLTTVPEPSAMTLVAVIGGILLATTFASLRF